MVLFCLFTAFIKYMARGIQRFSMYVEDLLPSGCCLLAHGWLSTVAWNLPDFLGSANLIFSVSQPHSPLIYAVCSLWFPCLCPSTRWSSSQKDENKTRNLFHPAPSQSLTAFPLFFCFLITLTFSYNLTSILPPPWTTVTNSITVLLTDNSNELFLFLNYSTSVVHLSSAFCFWDILLTTHSCLSWRISFQLFTFQNFVCHLLLFTCFTCPNLIACSLSSSLSLAPWRTNLAAAAAKSLQSCPSLCDPIDGSPPGSPIPGILQARTLECVAISFSKAWKWKVKVKSLSHVRLLVTPWTTAYQAPPSLGFSRQEYWSELPLPSLWPT